MKISVFRKAHFNAAHRLHNPNLSAERNQELFGKCNYPNYHGHNYVLEVKITGEIDPETGYVIDLGVLKGLIEQYVVKAFDHRNLNLDVPDFKELNPTVENIAIVIYKKLRAAISEHLELGIRLYETERNFVEINP
ncbi:MAG: 6-carboxytetrahydropterin synthase [Flavobacteriales bacterium]|nr:6-carboxytetrahydropterin synthase [Bacteroidota bacterium]MCB9239800.1 6-carboxytetrahydropterin synthase [Flavobacteriales bacterium]